MSNLAETILRDVPIRGRIYTGGRINTGGNCLDELVLKKDVEAALTAAMDPALTERAGEVLPRLRKADEYEPLGHDGWEAADLITALLAQNAALQWVADEGKRLRAEAEAERDALRAERDAAHALASERSSALLAAEATIATLTEKVEAMRGALKYYKDTFCEGFCGEDCWSDEGHSHPDLQRDCSGCLAASVLIRAALAAYRGEKP